MTGQVVVAERCKSLVTAASSPRGLLSQERIELLMSWRRSGFSVHNRVYVPAGDRQGLEALARYMMRSPASLSRLRHTPGSSDVVCLHKGGHDGPDPSEGERVDAMECVTGWQEVRHLIGSRRGTHIGWACQLRERYTDS